MFISLKVPHLNVHITCYAYSSVLLYLFFCFVFYLFETVLLHFLFSLPFLTFSFCSTNEEEPSRSSPSQNAAEPAEARKEKDDEKPGPSSRASGEKEGEGEGDKEGEKSEEVEAVLTEEDLIQQSQAEYDSGRYSPVLLQSSELPLDAHVMDVEEDLQRLQLARRQMQVTGVYMEPLRLELNLACSNEEVLSHVMSSMHHTV